MAVCINEEQILSCTVGQLEHSYSIEGVKTEELGIFIQYLKDNIYKANSDIYIQILYPMGDNKNANNTWRNHFDYFMGKYKFDFDDLFYKKSCETVTKNLNILVNSLVCNGLNQSEANAAVQNSIVQFLDYHNDLHKKNKTLQKTKSSILKRL